MPRAKLTFRAVVQDAQNYGSFDQNDDHMVSVIEFDLEIGSQIYPDMRVEVRQP